MNPSPPEPNWQPTAVKLRQDKKEPCSLRDSVAPIEFDLAGVRWMLPLSWFEGESYDPEENAARFVRSHLTTALERYGFTRLLPEDASPTESTPSLFPEAP